MGQTASRPAGVIRSVALDPASRTSAALTRILLERRYGVHPRFVEGEDPDADARLVIGDPALKTRLNGCVVLDLAAEWRAFTGRAFVFAFWAVRAGVDGREAGRIVQASRDRARAEPDWKRSRARLQVSPHSHLRPERIAMVMPWVSLVERAALAR